MATKISTIPAGGVEVFYRSAGSPSSPVLLLLHGFPASSFQFRNLIPLLSSKYHVVAPDLPGFGFTKVPATYKYSFASLADTLAHFLDALSIKKMAMYIFDYGAPTGLRLALQRPESITAIITQNGNAYEQGLGGAWQPLQNWWAAGSRTAPQAEVVRTNILNFDTTKWQYTHGSPTPDAIPPETYTLDASFLAKPEIQELQLDLFYDYQNNFKMYPQFQEYLRSSKVPVLAVWGKGDLFFIPPGAEAFARDVKDFEIHMIDASHFALETNEELFSKLILEFLGKRGI